MKLILKTISIILIACLTFSLLIFPASVNAESIGETNNNYYVRSYGALPVDESILDEYLISPSTYATHTASDYSYDLPSRVDLSSTKYFPAIGNQGHIGSCVAYATTYYQFTYETALLNDLDAKNNRDFVKSPLWVYNRINSGQNKGTTSLDAYDFLQTFGSVAITQNPVESYDPTKPATPEIYTSWECDDTYVREALKTRLCERATIKIDGNTATPFISSSTDSVLNDVKKALAIDQKVLTLSANFTNEIEVNITNTINEEDVVYEKAIVATTTNDSNHLITVVGYNDNIYVDLNNNGIAEDFEFGAFKIANSWGPSYANDGYCWVMYDAFNFVSNADNLNFENRAPFGYTKDGDVRFTAITVENYSTDLIAEYTIETTDRSSMDLFVNDVEFASSSSFMNEFFFWHSGSKPYSGKIYFDLSPRFSLENIHNKDKCYFIAATSDENLTINSIALIDNLGNIIAKKNENTIIDYDTLYENYITFPSLQTGDINYDNIISSEDKSMIQRYLIKDVEFSSIQEKIADINKDKIIDVSDLLLITQLISQNLNRKLFDWEQIQLGTQHPTISGLNSDTTIWRADFVVSNNEAGLAPNSTKCIAITNTVGATKTTRAAINLPSNWMNNADKIRVWVANFDGTVTFEFRGVNSMSYKKWIGTNKNGWIEFDLSGKFYKNGPDSWEYTIIEKETISNAHTLWISFENQTANSTVYLDDIELLD